jgi:hypothetical protein
MTTRIYFSSIQNFKSAVAEFASRKYLDYVLEFDNQNLSFESYDCRWKVLKNFLDWANIPYSTEQLVNPWDKMVHTYQK